MESDLAHDLPVDAALPAQAALSASRFGSQGLSAPARAVSQLAFFARRGSF
jgi:hypothetical protein